MDEVQLEPDYVSKIDDISKILTVLFYRRSS